MITREDLYQLGYGIKTRNMYNGSTDYHYMTEDERPYLVNLSKNGNVTIAFPINKPQKQFSTSQLNDFINWHNNYRMPKK